MVTAKVVKVLDPVDADNPVLTGESFLQGVKSRALRRHGGVSNSVNSSSRGEHACIVVITHVNLHQAVLHGFGSFFVDLVLSSSGEEIALLDLIGPDTFGNANHPEELVNVVSGVANETTKDNQNVVDLMLAHDRVADFLARTHGLAYSRNVCVVPSVVVDKRGSVSHATDLGSEGALVLLGAFRTLALGLRRSIGLLDLHVCLKELRSGNSSGNTNNGGQSKNETDHDTSEIACEHSVDDDEDVLISQVLETHVNTGGEEPDEEVHVKEE
ncbi:hypothetical protein HG531_002388 [Fusarium graminearum]|nr:hypothetical protein HG531_002388 [Fusarium graminearum]